MMDMPVMDPALNSSPNLSESRNSILPSFLRGRARGQSQSRPANGVPVEPHLPSPDSSSPPRHIYQEAWSNMFHQRRNEPPAPTPLIVPSNSDRSSGMASSAPVTSVLAASPVVGPASATPQPRAGRGTSTSRPSSSHAVSAHMAASPSVGAGPPAPGTHRVRLVPHIENRRSLKFDAVTRDLAMGQPLRIGRFTERSGTTALSNPNKLAFKSKVVSRAHAEIWIEASSTNPEQVLFFMKDAKSSSGTFLNHQRLSPANTESKKHQIKDGDIIQLGVDYQGGTEDVYKSVKMRVEIGREWQRAKNAFNTNAFKNLKTLTVQAPTLGSKTGIPDCCICLFGVTVRQALFIAPCSHVFHYKCLRPMLADANFPAFTCPVCRSFADLDEDVEIDAVEEEEEAEISVSAVEAADIEMQAPNADPNATPVMPGPLVTRVGGAGEDTDVENDVGGRDRDRENVTLTSRMRRRTLNPAMTLDEAAELAEADEEEVSDEGAAGTSAAANVDQRMSEGEGTSSDEGREDSEGSDKRMGALGRR